MNSSIRDFAFFCKNEYEIEIRNKNIDWIIDIKGVIKELCSKSLNVNWSKKEIPVFPLRFPVFALKHRYRNSTKQRELYDITQETKNDKFNEIIF